MTARITINLTADGLFEMWLNEEGRDLLVNELKRLNESNEHLHLGATDTFEDIQVQTRPYQPDDKVFDCGKIYFRTDAWDREYFPHVLNDPAERNS